MELIVVAGVMTVVTMGVANVMTNMYQQYHRIQLDQTLENLRIQYVAAITGSNNSSPIVTEGLGAQDSWGATLADAAGNPGLACLRNNTPCADGTNAGLRVWTGPVAANDILYDPAVATTGYRMTGELCNNFPDAGCPIRYNVTYTLRCDDNGATCQAPSVDVNLALDFNPAGGGFSADDIQKLEGRWNFTVRKGGKSQVYPVTVAEVSSAAVPPGNCPVGAFAGAWCPRKVATILEDPSNAIAALSGAANYNITFRPGTYSCHITMPAYAVNGFRVRLLDVAAGAVLVGQDGSAAEAAGRAPQWTYSGAVIEMSTQFSATANFVVRVQMMQESNPPAGVAAGWSFGMLSAPYTGVNLTVMRCMRTLQ